MTKTVNYQMRMGGSFHRGNRTAGVDNELHQVTLPALQGIFGLIWVRDLREATKEHQPVFCDKKVKTAVCRQSYFQEV
jgi:hypothetical protein